jgi:peptidoglycan/LPS O-acetylase OafA/YrhL
LGGTLVFIIGPFLALSVPYTRLPLFFMGLLAGKECGEKNPTFLPMPHFGSWAVSPCCCCCIGEDTNSEDTNVLPPTANPAKAWAWQVDICSTGLLFFYLLLIVVRNSASSYGVYIGSELASAFFQIFNAWPYLMLLVGLTRDEHTSCTARFLTSRPMKLLGKVSMSAYLLHEVLLYYFAAWWNGDYSDQTTWTERQEMCHFLPPWAVCVIVPLGILGGFLLTRFFEAPMRNLLRVRANE